MKSHSQETKPIKLASYIWTSIRSSMLLSFLALTVFSILSYGSIIALIKSRNLDHQLATANSAISEALEIGDWEFVLNVLKASSATHDIFDLTLMSLDGKSIYSGPIGAAAWGHIVLCQSNSQSTKLRGCIKVMGLMDYLSLIVFIFGIVLFSLISFRLLRSRAFHLFDQLTDFLSTDMEQKTSNIEEIESIRTRLVNLIKEKEFLSQQKALAELATQVAHDIRSPLSALRLAIAKMKDIESDRKALIQNATQRIDDIANKLLDRHRLSANHSRQPIVIDKLVSQLIEEKRAQWTNQQQIKISFSTSEDGEPNISAIADSSDLTSVLSNLINNSAESFGPEGGFIEVQTYVDGGNCAIRISDNGPGIPQNILSSIGQRGLRSGKSGGSGLGLYHAKQKTREWNSDLTISTEEGHGTTIVIKIPRHLPSREAGV